MNINISRDSEQLLRRLSGTIQISTLIEVSLVSRVETQSLLKVLIYILFRTSLETAHYGIEILVLTSTPDLTPNNIRRAERKNLTASEAWGGAPRAELGRLWFLHVCSCYYWVFKSSIISTEVGCTCGVWLELYV